MLMRQADIEIPAARWSSLSVSLSSELLKQVVGA